ncbi:metalloregulator ArsR/SmtB family transcription factor [Nocardioides sp.]|uniref:helix-turn-helix transcriptional regulator n=1 Tax=Nocardioides sp. TaxID=35761 RepID=UPI002732416B|nr:helix-turn-helix domain-containing protein [Nocardioides sp.]MDP3893574.1 helix-turn-helix domain-containing protein [Nocardioides sp.]
MEFAKGSVASPEGDAPTRARVARTILENGPSTAADLGRELDLTPAAVRRHLDHLVEDGTVEAGEQRVYGHRGRGRPARVFRLTETGRDSFEQQYDDLAAEALRFLRETQGEEAVMAFARRRVAFIERDYAAVCAARPDLTPAEALATVLTAGGYAASVRSLPIGDQLCQQHCPVSHVAHEFPQLCDAETEAIGQVLGRHVQRLATIAHGDGVCTTCIPDPVATVAAGDSTPGPTDDIEKDGASS